MEEIVKFLTIALSAIAVENVVFARALGINKSALFLKSPNMAILYGAVFTWTVCVTSLPVALYNSTIGRSVTDVYTRSAIYLFCIIAVYISTFLSSKKLTPALHEKISPVLAISSFNTALFGVAYVSSSRMFNFASTMGYALGAGVGYTIALLVIYYARKRLSASPVPRSFRGLPILLVYIGLLSLAIYGLLGHGLAA